MDENVKQLSQQIVTKIDRKVRSTIKKDGHKLGKTVMLGADGTPTKYIDKIAEDVAVKTIKKSKISLNLLSEEIGFIDNGGKYTIVLDPVDGTRNLYRGIPFYAISLGIGSSVLTDVFYGIVKNIAAAKAYGSKNIEDNRQYPVALADKVQSRRHGNAHEGEKEQKLLLEAAPVGNGSQDRGQY